MNIINKNKQKGMTLIGWVLVIGLITFFAVLGTRAFPIYMEGFKVKGALKSLQQQPAITKSKKSEILKLLFNRFDIDDVENVKREDITIENNNGILRVEIKFEVRKPAMGNIDIVGKFHEKVEVIAN